LTSREKGGEKREEDVKRPRLVHLGTHLGTKFDQQREGGREEGRDVKSRDSPGNLV
jgi:hypothetical protein